MMLSSFGQKFQQVSGILQLMDDLGEGIQDPDAIMLGGGNPSAIAGMNEYFRTAMQEILGNPGEFEDLIGVYSTPQGYSRFLEALATFFRDHHGWKVTSKNIMLTCGSQTGFFFLFNMFAGPNGGKVQKKILLPLAPEYIGYEDLGLWASFFRSFRPSIEFLDDHLFKYRVDFSRVTIDEDIGAICVSRPTNPTGNVITENELEKLYRLACDARIPLIIDNAYGTPFPGIVFTEAKAHWRPGTIMCMSLSKLGLPGTRTGIIVADEQTVKTLSNMNAILSLAPGNLGAGLALRAIETGKITSLCRDEIKPFYESCLTHGLECIKHYFDGLDYFVHKPEGSMFFWLWFRGLPISSAQLYQRLKRRKVLVVPGHYFFPGLENDDWQHKSECIRVNFGRPAHLVKRGLEVIADEVRRVYS